MYQYYRIKFDLNSKYPPDRLEVQGTGGDTIGSVEVENLRVFMNVFTDSGKNKH